MNFHIHNLTDHPQFIPTLSSWHQAQWGYLNPHRSEDDRAQEFQEHLRGQSIPVTFIALDGETLLGSASLLEHDLPSRIDLTPWLASVFVAPLHRQQGIGNALVARVEEEAQRLEINTLYLFTPDREEFYARRGWQTFERAMCSGEAITLMSLQLTGS